MSSSSSTVIITMKLSVLTTPPSSFPLIPKTNTCPFPNYTHNLFNSPKSTFSKPSKIASVSSQHTILDTNIKPQNDIGNKEYNIVSIGTQIAPAFVSLPKWNMSDQASFLLTFIVCTTSVSFTSLVFAAVPTITAMGRAALSLSKLADTAREELPSTMAAVRLSGMEISDLTLELSDLREDLPKSLLTITCHKPTTKSYECNKIFITRCKACKTEVQGSSLVKIYKTEQYPQSPRRKCKSLVM
ncbi:hypothetical protein Leryth_027107 [Lithospermum erythrorhizon]|nr:hypothetical protein Leryth_027107 [Lithospermum erythrorhizon]